MLEAALVGMHFAHDLGLPDLGEAVLLVCQRDPFKGKRGGSRSLSHVVVRDGPAGSIHPWAEWTTLLCIHECFLTNP